MLQFITSSFFSFGCENQIIFFTVKREIIKIDEELCNGCGQCVPNCHEGALQVIDGKVRLISELMCDGLGACIGHCPEGAITIESREAEPYDELKVIASMVSKGKNTVMAHLKHLKDHRETGFLGIAVNYLKENSGKLSFNLNEVLHEVHNSSHHHHGHNGGGCPGSKAVVIESSGISHESASDDQPSELRQWPVQMHLLNPNASYLVNSDLLLAADCVAFSVGNFHTRYLRGRSLAIACPKLDHGTDIYIEKLTAMIDNAKVNTITVMMMEVPCCGGLLNLVKKAQQRASRKVPVKQLIISLSGEVLDETWV
jgi:NAD-dependent dihydropyrimidine dehydrogenase PreA subunit